MKKLVLLALLGGAIGALVWAKYGRGGGTREALKFESDARYSHWVGRPVEFSFTALDGRTVAAADLRGKVVLLDFWATWCGPCLQSLPHLKRIHEEFGPQGLEIVAFNFDRDRAAVERVIQQHQLPWPQHFEGPNNRFGRQFGIRHYPSAWLVDRAGNVRYISALADTENKIKTLLAESGTRTEDTAARAKKHFLNRMLKGMAMETGITDATVRARDSETNEVATLPAPAAADPRVTAGLLAEAAKHIRLRSVVISARPSAVLWQGLTSQYVMVGDEVRFQSGADQLDFRVERIEPGCVTLRAGADGPELQLRLE
jgi:thiol-disulfide isomerase/thioredoxin